MPRRLFHTPQVAKKIDGVVWKKKGKRTSVSPRKCLFFLKESIGTDNIGYPVLLKKNYSLFFRAVKKNFEKPKTIFLLFIRLL